MKRFTWLLVVASILGIQGCAVDGCTDPNAVNFDSAADTNDGSCTYEGEVVFWYGEATSIELIDYLSSSLNFYVDGQIVGSTATTQFWNGAPDCGSNASITVTENLGGVTSRALTYEVIDDWGDVIWEGVVNFEANTCTTFELVW
jgi:hypothetical protein